VHFWTTEGSAAICALILCRSARHRVGLFQQNNVVCYVLTLAAVSKGKQFVLFTAEDEFGLMVGHREIIMQPAPHLGPLEVIDSDFAEGRFVGLLPHQGPSLAR
jgi:hypothetical protein